MGQDQGSTEYNPDLENNYIHETSLELLRHIQQTQNVEEGY